MDYHSFKDSDWQNMKDNLPFDYNFRQFKLFLEMDNDKGLKEMQIIKIPYIVNSFETLKKALLEYEPQHAYISVARFLNPHKVAQKAKNFNKPGYKLAQNIFLGAELVIDIDNKDLKNKDKILKVLDEKYCCNFEEIKIYQTKRGFHIWIMDFQEFVNFEKEFENPIEREEYNHKWRVIIADHLKEEKCNFDYATTIDIRRIMRIPYSIYNNNFIISELK